MKMPSVIVSFKEKGITAIERSQRGIIALVIYEATPTANFTVYTASDIPESITDANKEQIQLCLMGYQTAPFKVLVYPVQGAADSKSAEPIATTLGKLEVGPRFDYLVIPDIAEKDVQTVATWIKTMRTTKDTDVKAVLPNCAADNEGVVNFTNTTIKTKTKSYTTAQYCSRVAGIICGTPMTISCTYAPVPEVVEVESYTQEQMDDKVNRGEFFFFNDGEKIKVARGINSYVTTVQGKGEDFKKIKLVDLMDMIHDDIKKTGHDSYIGKYANSYDNRCLLVTAINGYFHELEREGLLERNQNNASIDLEATKVWLESNGLYTRDELAGMKDIEIKEANIHDNVFLTADLSLLDAIEHIEVPCNIQ